MVLTVDIIFNKPNKSHSQGECVRGGVVLGCKTEMRHEGIVLEMEGCVQMQLSGKNMGLLDTFSSTAKPIQLCHHQQDVAKAGRILPGKTEIAFECPLEHKVPNRSLYETYHGVFVAVQYTMKCDIKRSFPNKSIQKKAEFVVEYRKDQQAEKALSKPLSFTITPESVQNKERAANLPRFSIKGKLDSCSCLLANPVCGEVVVEKCDTPLKSVELQLIRIETCGSSEGHSRDATEIQTLQIGEGDIPKGLPVPIYMVLPRLFVCPSIETPNFKVDFELNLMFMFSNDQTIKESFPLTLHRW